MGSTIRAFLQLMRPANLVTAVSDIFAGIAISGFFLYEQVDAFSLHPVWMLILATLGLYGGGVVFNDVFDADLDRVERPERPIPSGRVSLPQATFLGMALLFAGVWSACWVNSISALLAGLICLAALVYDKFTKPHPWLGPLNMGICRGLNLLLGLSIDPSALYHYYPLALLPVIFIAAITLVSRGEVHGSSSRPINFAFLGYFLVLAVLILFSVEGKGFPWSLFFILAFGWMIIDPLERARKDPQASKVKKAVKAGILGLILMNASWVAIFIGWPLALGVALLLPISILLAAIFAVT
ncbi:MAG: UbiA-like protein EboC [Chitinophagaceae bacterium]